MVSTNSYKVSTELLRNLDYFKSHPHAPPDLADQMLRASVHLARQAITRHQATSPPTSGHAAQPLIAATLGPFSISRPFQSAIGTAVDRAQKATASVDEIAAFHRWRPQSHTTNAGVSHAARPGQGVTWGHMGSKSHVGSHGVKESRGARACSRGVLPPRHRSKLLTLLEAGGYMHERLHDCHMTVTGRSRSHCSRRAVTCMSGYMTVT